MAILLDFFDNVILQAITEEIVPKRGFFKDRYFPTGAGDIFKANEVLTEYRSGDRKLAAFVDQKAGDIPIGRRSYEVHSYKPAYIAPSRLLTLDELTKRGFGEALYPGMDEAQRAARLLADDMNDMENRIAGTEEWMAAQTMISNGCTMQEMRYAGVHRRCNQGRFSGCEVLRRHQRSYLYRFQEVERERW